MSPFRTNSLLAASPCKWGRMLVRGIAVSPKSDEHDLVHVFLVVIRTTGTRTSRRIAAPLGAVIKNAGAGLPIQSAASSLPDSAIALSMAVATHAECSGPKSPMLTLLMISSLPITTVVGAIWIR